MGCSSDSSSETDGTSSTEGTITQVTITGANSVLANGTAELTANLILSGTVDTSKVTYSWNITNGGNYASLSSYNKNTTTLKANDVTQQQSVTVLVIVKYGNLEKTAQKTITVTAKSSDSGSGSSMDSGSSAVLSGVSVTASSSTIDYNGKATLTATPSFSSGSSEDVTYEWEITYGDSYAALTSNGATATLYNKNSDTRTQYVVVKVTAKCGETEKSSYKGFYVQEKKYICNMIYKIEEKFVEVNSDGTVTLTDSAGNTQSATADRKDNTLTIYDLNGDVLYSVETYDSGSSKIDTFKDGDSQSVEAEFCYVVEHLQQNAEDDYYTLVEKEILAGKYGEQTAAAAKSYKGFNTPSFIQKGVSSWETTTVEIKYERKRIYLDFYITDFKYFKIYGRYGARVTPPENPTREGYTFDGWDSEIPETFPSESKTITALWTANSLGSITARAPEYSDDEDFLSVDASDPSKITFTASADSPCYWYVDGYLKQKTGTTFTMNISDYPTSGYYTVMAISGNHSATVQVAVTK